MQNWETFQLNVTAAAAAKVLNSQAIEQQIIYDYESVKLEVCFRV